MDHTQSEEGTCDWVIDLSSLKGHTDGEGGGEGGVGYINICHDIYVLCLSTPDNDDGDGDNDAL